MTSPIHVDESNVLIVIHCDEHDWYRSCRFHRDEAHDAACAHEEREHPNDYRQRDARAKRVARRVARAERAETSKVGEIV